MRKAKDKTNVMRVLDSFKLTYETHNYLNSGAISGVDVATALNQNADAVFKTLVTQSCSKKYYVFLLPVEKELDLKKAAKLVDEKKIEMLPAKNLLALTGYVHGGCSPIGMKKPFPTVIHQSAENYDTIIFSGGKIGYQVEISLGELSKAMKFSLGDVVVG